MKDTVVEIYRRVHEIIYSPNMLQESGLLLQDMVSSKEGYEAPETGWYKLNSDGACGSGGFRSACGGVIRNSTGEWVSGFSL